MAAWRPSGPYSIPPKRFDLKYNYVILSTDWDVYRQLYSDIIGREDVCYVAGPQATKRGLRKMLYRLHFNKKLNLVVPLPFKRIWNRSYFSASFKEKKPVCFVLFRDWVSMNAYTGYIDWLKREYPGAKFVWILHDTIAEHRDFYTGKILDIDRYKQELDLVVTCNREEAVQRGLYYHHIPISKLAGERPEWHCDVLFIGQDKGRMNRLLRIYDDLTQKGARCRFFITNTTCKKDDKDREGITCLEQPMSYKDCQAWVAGSNCLLELRYSSAAGETLRASEALIYGKKLITDNPALAESPDFTPQSIRILGPEDGTEHVDLSFITSSLEMPADKMESYRKRLSPVALLEEFDSLLSE